MTAVEKNFGILKEMYAELLKTTMELNGIKEIKCSNKKEPFFDKVVLNEDNRIEVYKRDMNQPFQNLCFDFTLDYAKCISYIEEDLFLVQRNTTSVHGMSFIFLK